MKRKIKFAAIVALLITAVLVLVSCFEKDGEGSTYGLEFRLNDDEEGYTLVGIGECTESEITVDAYKGLPVTRIGAAALSYSSAIRKVTLGESVLEIEEHAFSNCRYLSDITLPENLSEIGNYAFRNCASLESINLPESVSEIADGTFMGCSRLKSVSLPAVRCIHKEAFRDCEALETVVFSDNLYTVEELSFSGCNSLRELVTPVSLVEIGDSAFFGCKGLEKIVLSEYVLSIGNKAFSNCTALEEISVHADNEIYRVISGALCTADGKELIQYPLGNAQTSFTVPESVRKIHSRAFSSAPTLKSVSLSKTETVGYEAFFAMPALAEVDFGMGLTFIDENAFAFCDRLLEVVLPDSLKEIGKSAFWSCDALSFADLGDGVEVMGEHAFMNCISLRTLIFPVSLTSIGEYAFWECTAMKTSYYTGSLSDFIKLSENAIGMGNYGLGNSKICMYSETAPDKSSYSYYWYWGENGEPVMW